VRATKGPYPWSAKAICPARQRDFVNYTRCFIQKKQSIVATFDQNLHIFHHYSKTCVFTKRYILAQLIREKQTIISPRVFTQVFKGGTHSYSAFI